MGRTCDALRYLLPCDIKAGSSVACCPPLLSLLDSASDRLTSCSCPSLDGKFRAQASQITHAAKLTRLAMVARLARNPSVQ